MQKARVLSRELLPVIVETLNQNHAINIRVSGTSMRPFLKHQQTVVSIKKIDGSIKKYDILLYSTKDHSLVLHRVIKTNPSLILCGDGRLQTETIENSQIIGRVNGIYENNKSIDINSKLYKLKIKSWVFLRFFRRILLKLFIQR